MNDPVQLEDPHISTVTMDAARHPVARYPHATLIFLYVPISMPRSMLPFPRHRSRPMGSARVRSFLQIRSRERRDTEHVCRLDRGHHCRV